MGNFLKTDKIFCLVLWLLIGTFSSPGHKFWFLTFFQFLPLFYILEKYPNQWLKTSFIFGIFYYSIYYKWLIYPLQYTNFSPYIFGSLNVILMSIYQSIYFIIFCFFFISFSSYLKLIISPIIWGCCELIKANILTGFPWGELSYNLFKHPDLVIIAKFIKSEGVSSIILFINILIFFIIFKHKKIKNFLILLTAIIILTTANLLIKKSNHYPKIHISVGVIQGNIPEKIKIQDKNAPFVLNRYITLTKKLLKKTKPDLIIWPEAIYTIPFENDNSSLKNKFLNFVKKNNLNIIFGSPYIHINPKKYTFKVYNSMYFIKNDKIFRYDKIHLVPFGEYTPLKKILFFVNKIVPGEDFSHGKEMKIFKLNDVKIIPLICYEGIFRNLIEKGIKKGGNLIVNISNEAWFGKSFALWQHLSANVFRAIEAGRYFIKCANSGISAVISPNGKIISLIPPNKIGTIILTLK